MTENLDRLRALTEQLTETEESLLDLVVGVIDCLPNALLLVRSSGVIARANIAACLMFRAGSALIGRLVDELVAPQDRERLRVARAAYFDGPLTPIVLPPILAMRQDHTLFPVEIWLAPLKRTPNPLVFAVVRDLVVTAPKGDATHE